MILIITMAGTQAYGNEAYRSPSYLLPWGERTVLATILGELCAGGALSDVVLVANERDADHMPHVRAIMRGLGIDKRNLFLTPSTSGQAETAFTGLTLLEERTHDVTSPILFHNVDSILLRRDLGEVASALKGSDGYVDVFRSNNHNYSYVLLDDDRRVMEIAEKIVISDMATSGLYGFSSAAVFREHYVRESDRHISAVYKRMISRNHRVIAGRAHAEEDTIVLNTPADYINASIMLG